MPKKTISTPKLYSHPPVKIALSKAQISKIKNAVPIQLNPDAIEHQRGYTFTNLHPDNYKKVMNALSKKKGTRIHLTAHELHGSGLFDSIWQGIKTVGNVLKDTGLATPLADFAKKAITPFVGENVATGLREGLRGATGVGIKKRGTAKKTGVKKTTTKKNTKAVKGFSHGSEFMVPQYYPGQPAGSGIIPAGYY